MKKFLTIFALFTLLHFYTLTLYADDCTPFKVIPDVSVSVPAWTKSVVQPDQPMNLLHGNVDATLTEGYSLLTKVEQIDGGYCVVLTGVEAAVGYTSFLIQIDRRHAFGSCGYDATLSHEYEHIRSHLTTIDDSKNEIKSAITRAATSIMPVFVPAGGDMNDALDTMQTAMQNHPDIVLMKQKIDAEQEINDHHVDQRDNGDRIKQCMDQ